MIPKSSVAKERQPVDCLGIGNNSHAIGSSLLMPKNTDLVAVGSGPAYCRGNNDVNYCWWYLGVEAIRIGNSDPDRESY